MQRALLTIYKAMLNQKSHMSIDATNTSVLKTVTGYIHSVETCDLKELYVLAYRGCRTDAAAFNF